MREVHMKCRAVLCCGSDCPTQKENGMESELRNWCQCCFTCALHAQPKIVPKRKGAAIINNIYNLYTWLGENSVNQ